jgi:hypothetical protein
LKLVIRFVECNNGRLPLVLGVAVTIQWK